MKKHLVLSILACASIAFSLTALPMKVSVQTGDTLNFVPFLKQWDTTATFVSIETSVPLHGTLQTVIGWFDSNHYYIPMDTFTNKSTRPSRLKTPVRYPGFRYVPAAGFTGRDSFSYRVATSNGSSNTATCVVRVTPPEPGNMTVLLIVNQALLASIQVEVNRLKTDLENEGYHARILPWALPTTNYTPTHAKQVWDTLVAEYDKIDRMLAGVILIGQIPIYRMNINGAMWEYESAFWSMGLWEPDANADSSILGHRVGKGGNYEGVQYTPGFMNIWVSHMNGAGVPLLGTEIDLIKRVLQNNHDYRTGASRLPHTALFYSMFSNPSNMNPHKWGKGIDPSRYLDIWPSLETHVWNDTTHPFRFEFKKGGQIWEHITHGGTAPHYWATLNGGTTRVWYYNQQMLWNAIFPVRFMLANCCHTGQLGQLTNQHLLVRGSGCVLSMSSTDYVSNGFYLSDTGLKYPPHARTRNYMAQGDRWGRAWLRGNGWIWTVNFHGDLSLKPNMDPANAKPLIMRVDAEKTGALSWRFTATASDADDGITGYDWWGKSYNYGKAEPDSSGMSSIFTATYDSSSLCTVRVEVADHFKACDWACVIIKTDSGVVSNYAPPAMHGEEVLVDMRESSLSLSPNPFNPEVTVFLPVDLISAKASLFQVYSPAGRLIFEKRLDKRESKIKWNGKERSGSAAAGVYVFRITAGPKTMSVRGVLVK